MADMLVRLFDLPAAEPVISRLAANGVFIRRARTTELSLVRDYAETQHNTKWADQVLVAMAQPRPTLYVAVVDEQLTGFCCYDATAKGFYGPVGVHPEFRGRGIGEGITLATLNAMWMDGYAYAIIGGVGPADFYRRVCGAEMIENSTPGYYARPVIKR